jgi:hypothetical protein
VRLRQHCGDQEARSDLIGGATASVQPPPRVHAPAQACGRSATGALNV